MLKKPESCQECPLLPHSTGFMVPQTGTNGVALIGEALGKDEAELGKPFQGKAGFRLTRLLEWAGFDRKDFSIYNTVWCRPPNNKLEGEWYESRSVAHCRERHWGHLLNQSRVLVPMGNVATGALLGRKGILRLRGYVAPGPGDNYVIPTVHPSFIQRGQSRWSAAFIADIQKAVELADRGLPPIFTDYCLDPSPSVAYEWAKDYIETLKHDAHRYLAFDIETPGKGDDEEDVDTDSDAPDNTWHIWRIGFSYREHTALSIPWEPAYMAAIRLLLGSDGPKVVWNAGFDVPRVRRGGVDIRGTIHDGMVAWHILHSDLPKRLEFVATFTCPWQPAWKHLSGSKPALYNAIDADVEYQSMLAIESELRRTGLWEVYQRDVLDLEPILIHMQNAGMPIDPEVRADRAIKLDQRLRETKAHLEALFPLETRKIEHVYKKPPSETDGLYSRPASLAVNVCDACGAENPRSDHFKVFKKKQNPCGGAKKVVVTKPGIEWYRLSDFSPSRDQFIRYHQHLNRPLPLVWDKKAGKKKVSFAEKEIKKLILLYPLDEIYPLVLDYRSLDKIAGTYIGRPSDDPQ